MNFEIIYKGSTGQKTILYPYRTSNLTLEEAIRLAAQAPWNLIDKIFDMVEVYSYDYDPATRTLKSRKTEFTAFRSPDSEHRWSITKTN